MLTCLPYLLTLCFNLAEIISYVWDTSAFLYVIINQYIEEILSSNWMDDYGFR